MRHHALRRCVSAAAAVAGILATTACANTATSAGSAGNAGSAASATRTDWPQPDNGHLTADMCDILTLDDLVDEGVADDTTASISARAVPEAGPEVVNCRWGGMASVELTLNMQPDLTSATLLQKSDLADHRSSGSTAEFKENLLEAVDESWYDTTAADGAHELHARRGRLLVTVAIGAFTDAAASDASVAAAATALAGLVYTRLPSVGLAVESTGNAHQMQLTVTGATAGPVDVSYYDPIARKDVTESGVALPYSRAVTFPWYGTGARPLSLTVDAPASAKVKCKLEVDATVVASGSTKCSGQFSDPA